MHRWDLRRYLAVAGVAGLMIVSLSALAAGQTADDCDQLDGTIDGQLDTTALTTSGTIDSPSDLVDGASTDFQVVDFAAGAGELTGIDPQTVSYVGQITVATDGDTLTLRDLGMFEVTGEFSSISKVTAGTGLFEGSSGTFFFHGALTGAPDADGIAPFVAPFTAELCLTDD